MKCKRPFLRGVDAFGCGQCVPCRVKRRREWTGRLLLELGGGEAVFVTLTYAELPAGGNLVPSHLTLFLKRLRARLAPLRLRYFAVGEYGSQSLRPHFHLCLFGVGLEVEQAVAKAWPFGFVQVSELTRERAAYCCGYVVKKWTKETPTGLVPEFARMSLRPGIGAPVVDDLAAALTTRTGSAGVAALGDVPGTVRADGRRFPMGRYLKEKLRDACGVVEPSEAAAVVQERERLRDVRARLGPGAFASSMAWVDHVGVARDELRHAFLGVRKGCL